jgi:hypothetical protein
MNQSVLDELEFLDLGGMDNGRGEEAEFDFVYHLPHADFDRIILHNSISDFGKIEGFKKSEHNASMMNLADGNRDTSHVNMNRKKLSRALDPMFNGKKEKLRKKFKNALENSASRIGGSRLLGTSNANSNVPSHANLRRKSRGGGGSMMFLNGRKSLAASQYSPSIAPSSKNQSRSGSRNMLGSNGSRNLLGSSRLADSDDGGIKITVNGEDLGPPLIQIDDGSEEPVIHVGTVQTEELNDRDSASNPNGSNNVLGYGSSNALGRGGFQGSRDVGPFRSTNTLAKSMYEGSDYGASELGGPDIYEDAMNQIQNEEAKVSNFHALPLLVRNIIMPKIVAIISISIVAVIAIYVYYINIEKVVLGN